MNEKHIVTMQMLKRNKLGVDQYMYIYMGTILSKLEVHGHI